VLYQPHWYAIHTHPKQEERAHCNLQAWGIESLHPKLRERRLNPFTGAPIFLSKPLFPRYIFARFDAGSQLHKISFTRGVHSVVSFNAMPAPIDDEIIALIMSRMTDQGFVRINDDLKAGDRVIIKEGPLKSLIGIFEREIKDSDRVSILLEAVSYQGRMVVERDQVRKAS
jgi:transcription elongation factor/antiterminator RfaH